MVGDSVDLLVQHYPVHKQSLIKLAGDSGWSLSFPGSLLYDSCVISQQRPARAQHSPGVGPTTHAHEATGPRQEGSPPVSRISATGKPVFPACLLWEALC